MEPRVDRYEQLRSIIRSVTRVFGVLPQVDITGELRMGFRCAIVLLIENQPLGVIVVIPTDARG